VTIQLELNSEVAARLAAEARSRGMRMEEYVESLLRNATVPAFDTTGQLSLQELDDMLEAVGKDSERVPHLPTAAFTRESFYEDRR
jgi:hypothetical protein